MMETDIYIGDCLTTLPLLEAGSAHACITSPPYFGLRDYGADGQLGQEETPDAFVESLVAVFRQVRRVLRDDGTLWLNLGDSYAGSGKGQMGNGEHASKMGDKQRTNKGAVAGGLSNKNYGLKPKDLVGIPWRVAFALQADGWYLRQDIIWHKPNPMPESVTDRCTKAHEYMFLLSKSPRYYFDSESIQEPAIYAGQDTRNKRSVWVIKPSHFKGAHFATFPPELIEPCVLAGCPEGGTCIDPFGGAGTVGMVASRLQRNSVLCELNPEYAEMAKRRIYNDGPLFNSVKTRRDG